MVFGGKKISKSPNFQQINIWESGTTNRNKYSLLLYQLKNHENGQ